MNQIDTLFCIFLIWLTKRPLRNAKKKRKTLSVVSWWSKPFEPWPIDKILCFNWALLDFFPYLSDVATTIATATISTHILYPIRFCRSYRCSFSCAAESKLGLDNDRINRGKQTNKKTILRFTLHRARGGISAGAVGGWSRKHKSIDLLLFTWC